MNFKKLFKNKNFTILILLTTLLLILGISVGVAYAKIVTSVEGTATARVAKLICDMEVTPCTANDPTIVNPYCTVTLKNFRTENGVTTTAETGLNYTITVTPKSGLTSLPEYYWENANHEIIGNSQALTGSFVNGTPATQTYKIVFINEGTQDITAQVDFDIVAIQAGTN